MRQRQVRRAERAIRAQHREAAVDLPPALDPEHAGDPPLRMDAADVGGRRRLREHGRIPPENFLHQRDLLERRLDLFGPGHPGIDVHRPELAADMPSAQARDVGIILLGVEPRQVHRPARVARLVGQRLGPIVMPVDQRRLASTAATRAS